MYNPGIPENREIEIKPDRTKNENNSDFSTKEKLMFDTYNRYDISRDTIFGGTLEELLRPPVKSVGYRTETQIQLMRKMRYVSNKLNLTQVSISYVSNFRNTVY